MNVAFFFPGQGSQSLNMMAGFEGVPVVKATFDEASAVLQQDFWAMIHGDNADVINETIHTQPLMLTAGVATWRAFLAAGGQTPVAMAGHSLGEYTALVAAQALDFADALRLVRLRAKLMQEAVPVGEGGMAAILGLDDEAVRLVCAQAEADHAGLVAEAVNFNAPGQVVIAGSAAAIARAAELAKAAGAKRALPLPVSVPSHCRLMRPAADKLSAALAEVAVQTPAVRVWHNADVAAYQHADAIKDALVRQLYSPVRWTETVAKLVQEGVTQSAECGPGKVLAGLAKRIDKTATCTALTSAEQVAAFVESQA